MLRPSPRTSCACRSPAAARSKALMRKLTLVALLLIGGLILAALVWYVVRPGALKGTSRVVDATTQVINKGEYLARAGDCIACHTAPGGTPFAGGRAMPTPFGNLYASNITPDDETGIGRWTPDDFYRMMQKGLSRDGSLLYPAMPFASYTKVTREDCDAIYAYLMSVEPVRQKSRPHELRFPFKDRNLLVGWRTLYFKEGEYLP